MKRRDPFEETRHVIVYSQDTAVRACDAHFAVAVEVADHNDTLNYAP
jgi:hypothetical protein